MPVKATIMLSEAVQVQVDLFSERIQHYRAQGLRIFASSSFQSHSIPMLHLVSQVDKSIPVVFLNTGFHFPETLVYRDQIAGQLGLSLLNIKSPVSKYGQRDAEGRFLYATDPDHCCYLNKTLPMEEVLLEYDVWINGVRRDQSSTRSGFSLESPGPHGVLRFHPMLDWNSRMIWEYSQYYELPQHPLEAQGYFSVGCAPCTRRLTDEQDSRGGRWAGMKKTECGLHTELVEKKSI